jgi:hypothetical protein
MDSSVCDQHSNYEDSIITSSSDCDNNDDNNNNNNDKKKKTNNEKVLVCLVIQLKVHNTLPNHKTTTKCREDIKLSFL